MRRIVPVDTLTGVPLIAQVEVADADWESSLTRPGDATFVIPLRDQSRPVSRDLARRLCKGWATTYVVEWVHAEAFQRWGEVEYSGLVIDYDWDLDSGVLTVKTRELATLLQLRLLFTVGGYSVGTRHIWGQTLGDIIRESYRYAILDGYARWALPVDLPPYQSGPLLRTYWRYGFQSAYAWLDQLASEDGAPDHHLRGRWVAGVHRWRLEIGTPYLSAGTLRLPLGTPTSPIKSAIERPSKHVSYLEQRTGIYTVGAGSDEGTKYGQAGELAFDPDLPYLDSVQSFKQVDDPATLDALSRATIASTQGGIEQWSFTILATGRIAPFEVKVGTRLLLDHPGDELDDPRRIRLMVLSAAGKFASDRVRVEAQEF